MWPVCLWQHWLPGDSAGTRERGGALGMSFFGCAGDGVVGEARGREERPEVSTEPHSMMAPADWFGYENQWRILPNFKTPRQEQVLLNRAFVFFFFLILTRCCFFNCFSRKGYCFVFPCLLYIFSFGCENCEHVFRILFFLFVSLTFDT